MEKKEIKVIIKKNKEKFIIIISSIIILTFGPKICHHETKRGSCKKSCKKDYFKSFLFLHRTLNNKHLKSRKKEDILKKKKKLIYILAQCI